MLLIEHDMALVMEVSDRVHTASRPATSSPRLHPSRFATTPSSSASYLGTDIRTIQRSGLDFLARSDTSDRTAHSMSS